MNISFARAVCIYDLKKESVALWVRGAWFYTCYAVLTNHCDVQCERLECKLMISLFKFIVCII